MAVTNHLKLIQQCGPGSRPLYEVGDKRFTEEQCMRRGWIRREDAVDSRFGVMVGVGNQWASLRNRGSSAGILEE